MSQALHHQKRTVVEALVSLATRDGLGETVNWPEVRAAILQLLRDPIGPRDLRSVLENINDPSVKRTLEDWFVRAAAERDEDAKKANRVLKSFLLLCKGWALAVQERF